MTHARLAPAGLAAILGLALITGGCVSDRSLDPSPSPRAADLAQDEATLPETGAAQGFGRVVVANRGSGTVSVLDAQSGAPSGTFALPSGPNPPEPMYAVYVKRTHAVVVGDRANSRVVELDADGFAVQRTAPAGAGVFHMWVDPVRNRQLWVNNDIDNTATVIDPVTFDVITTVPMPADLVADGFKPHDVILEPGGEAAFVTLLGPGPDDHVVRFDTSTFTETARAAVGKDPHVSLTRRNQNLYVPCQNSDIVEVLDRRTLDPVATLTVPGAHGAGMTQSGRYFYTANLPGGGTDALWVIDTNTNTVVGDAVNAPFPVPHNIALTNNGRRLFLTHSGGSADQVSFYSVSAAQPAPVLMGTVTVGLNPFGITYVP
jgi:DNA-binding beta-propeller fold protein YncE